MEEESSAHAHVTRAWKRTRPLQQPARPQLPQRRHRRLAAHRRQVAPAVPRAALREGGVVGGGQRRGHAGQGARHQGGARVAVW